MKKKILLPVAIISSIILSFPVYSAGKIFEKPLVTVKSVGFDSISMTSINTILYLNVDNPNIWGIELKKVEYKLDINNVTDVAEGVTQKVIKIEKETKENPVEIPVSVKNKKILPTLTSIVKSPEKIEYSATGKVYFATFIGDIPIPFSRKSFIDNTETIDKVKSQIKSLKFW